VFVILGGFWMVNAGFVIICRLECFRVMIVLVCAGVSPRGWALCICVSWVFAYLGIFWFG